MLPILLSVGSIHLYSMSLFLILAWSVWSLVFWKALRQHGADEEHVFDLMFWATLISLIAARVGFVFLHQELFTGSPLKVVALWVQPGLAVYPGLTGGILTLLFFAKRHGMRLAHVVDALAFSLPGTFAIGSVGAALAGSIVGLPTRLPWAMRVVGYEELRHPVALYFAIASLGILGIIVLLEIRAKKHDWPLGLLGIWYFLLFSASFFAIEFLVSDSVYWGKIRANQWMLLAIGCQTIGAFYVRGGGRETIRPIVRKSIVSFIRFPRGFYDRIRTQFTRHATNKS